MQKDIFNVLTSYINIRADYGKKIFPPFLPRHAVAPEMELCTSGTAISGPSRWDGKSKSFANFFFSSITSSRTVFEDSKSIKKNFGIYGENICTYDIHLP